MSNNGILAVVGAFNRVGKLLNSNKKLKVGDALILVAKEIDLGVSSHRAGLTKTLSWDDIISGKFMGDKR